MKRRVVWDWEFGGWGDRDGGMWFYDGGWFCCECDLYSEGAKT